MGIVLTSICVSDQEQALRLSTEVLGFVERADFPVGEFRWLSVVSPEQPDGVELALEPDAHPAVPPYREALMADGIPATSFAVDDEAAGYDRLCELGVRFTQEPKQHGPVTTAVFDDTCGNLTQIAQRGSGS